MNKKAKVKKVKKRYICQKCGRNTAVKHGNGRYRCLECHSVYGPNSRKTCYNKDEYLVLKSLLKLFDFYGDDTPRNKKFSVEEYTKTIKELSDENFSKLSEINIIRHLSTPEKIRLIETTPLEEMIVITRDDYNRFRVYPSLFKKYNTYYFNNGYIKVHGTNMYACKNAHHGYMKEIEAEKRKRLGKPGFSYWDYH